MTRHPKDNPHHLDRGTHAFRGGIGGEYATPSEVAKRESKLFGEGVEAEEKTCPVRHKKFEKFATINPSSEEIQYYCPLCDALVMREFDDKGRRRTKIYDPEHMPEQIIK